MALKLTRGQRRLRARARGMKLDTVKLGEDDFGLYSTTPHLTGPYDTPLLFRGTFEETREWRNG